MAWENKEGQGALWRQADKRSDKAPDFTGEALLDGKKLRVVAWEKQTRNGGAFLSLAVEWQKPKREESDAF